MFSSAMLNVSLHFIWYKWYFGFSFITHEKKKKKNSHKDSIQYYKEIGIKKHQEDGETENEIKTRQGKAKQNNKKKTNEITSLKEKERKKKQKYCANWCHSPDSVLNHSQHM